MRGFRADLENDIHLEKEILRRDKRELHNLPDGYLSKSGTSYYQNISQGGERSKIYIPKSEERLAAALARKAFLQQRIARIEGNAPLQQKLLCQYRSYDDDSVLRGLPMSAQAVLLPAKNHTLGDDRDREVAGDVFGNLEYKTARGQLRRSKSEVIISNMLDAAGVKYYYEKRLLWPDFAPPELLEIKALFGLPNSILPDIIVPTRVRGRVYWEHMGLLKNPAYAQSWLEKQIFYHLLDINLGSNLIVTCDTVDGRLNSKEISDIICMLKGWM